MAEKVKQEPGIAHEEPTMELEEGEHEDNLESPQTLTGMGLLSCMYESIKDAASADIKPNRNAAVVEKLETRGKYDSYSDFDEENFINPDRTMADFYCNICDAHMNSEQMWESHVSGKRHLKNIKKEPGEMPSKVKAIKTSIPPKLMELIKTVNQPLVGLNYMTELQRAEAGLFPSYTCHLCQANLTWSVVVDHILGTKHRLAFLKESYPDHYTVIEKMELSKSALDRIVEDRAREFERKEGCGTIQVKLEKPKMVPPPPRQQNISSHQSHSRSLSSESQHERRRVPDACYYEPPRRNRSRSPPGMMYGSHTRSKHSSAKGRWRHDRYAADTRSPYPLDINQLPSSPDLSHLEWSQRISLLRELTENMILVTEDEVQQVKEVMKLISQSVLQYAIRQLPEALQDKLARRLARNFDNEDLFPTLNQVMHAAHGMGSRYQHRSSSSSSDQFY